MDSKKTHVNTKRLFPFQKYSHGIITSEVPERESLRQWIKDSANPEAAIHDLDEYYKNGAFERPGTYIYNNGDRARSDLTSTRKKRRSLKK